MDNSSNATHRFRRISRHNPSHLNVQLDENLEQWPHLNELLQCYTSDWVKDESKYGHYESVSPPHFHNQIFEGPDTEIQTGKSFVHLLLIWFDSKSIDILLTI
ncbi:hypothetical protein SLE2022_336440 [Rubroshorea leprosula]